MGDRPDEELLMRYKYLSKKEGRTREEDDERDDIFRHMTRKYEPIIGRLSQKFSGFRFPVEEMRQVSHFILLKVMMDWDRRRNAKFSTYFLFIFPRVLARELRDRGSLIKRM